MKNLIEKLKKNKTAFGLMSPEEQEFIRRIGMVNCEVYYRDGWKQAVGDAFIRPDKERIYAIKPDYQPEPEHVDLEIKRLGNWLGVYYHDLSGRWNIVLPHPFTHLHCLLSLPNFDQFRADNCPRIGIQLVATLISEGRTVYARLRKSSI